MSQIRSTFIIFMIIILLTGLFSLPSFAADDGKLHFSLESSAQKVFAGEEFVMTINLEENPGVAGFAFFLRYDPNLFEILGNDGSDSCFPGYVGTEVDSSNQFAWFDLGIILHGDNHSTGKLLDVTFRAKEEAVGVGDFYVDVYTAANFDEQAIYAESTTFSVSVKDVIPGDVNLDSYVDARDATQIMRHISGSKSIFDEASTKQASIIAADIDEDGFISEMDALEIMTASVS